MSIYLIHKHHIIPKHAGGTDDPSNLVELTVEDHAIAHKVLYGLYGRWQDEVAWKGLAGMIDRLEIIDAIQHRPRTQESKDKVREKTKIYWNENSEEAKLRRQSLIDFNKKTKSAEMKKRWKENPCGFGRSEESYRKTSETVKAAWANGAYCNRKRKKGFPVSVNGVKYDDSTTAGKALGLTKGCVYQRCKSKTDRNKDWYFL